MARIRIQVSEHGMLATVRATAGPAVCPAELDAAIAAARIVHGLDRDAVEAFARQLGDAAFAGSRVVARGDTPVPGDDARLDGTPPFALQPGALRADGSIDFRERQLLMPVAAGAELGRLVPPTPGQPGRDVQGNPVAPKPGKALGLRWGAGTRIDGDRLVATRSGVLVRDAKQVDVVALYSHAADVDYQSGSLHTEGSLDVRGDVHEGFVVTAAGDVHVGGSVQGTVHAEGSVRIDQGVLGAGASVRAGGDLGCRHATASNLHADGAVVLGDQAAHCHIVATSLVALTGRGALVGGEARVTHSMRLLVAGTLGGAATHLVVGDVGADTSFLVAAHLDAEVAERARHRGAGDGKPAAETLQVRLRMRELLADAYVEVTETLHAGVRVTFGDTSWECDHPRSHIRLHWCSDTETIVETDLQGTAAGKA